MAYTTLRICISRQCRVLDSSIVDRDTFGCEGSAHLLVNVSCWTCDDLRPIHELVRLRPGDLVDALLDSGWGSRTFTERLTIDASSCTSELQRRLSNPIHQLIDITILGPSSIEVSSGVRCGDLTLLVEGIPPGLDSFDIQVKGVIHTAWGLWRVKTADVLVEVL